MIFDMLHIQILIFTKKSDTIEKKIERILKFRRSQNINFLLREHTQTQLSNFLFHHHSTQTQNHCKIFIKNSSTQ